MTKSEFEKDLGEQLKKDTNRSSYEMAIAARFSQWAYKWCEKNNKPIVIREIESENSKLKKENEVLKQVVKDAFELARSAASIAGRQGYQTNWDAFESRVRSFIEITKELLEKEGVEL